MNNLSELKMLGYTVKNHILGYVLAVSPHGKQSLYAPNGELMIHWVDTINITNKFILAYKDSDIIAFTTYDNKQIKGFNYTSADMVTVYKNTILVYTVGESKVYNFKGEQVGDKIKDKRKFRNVENYYYSDEENCIYWLSTVNSYTTGILYRDNDEIAHDVVSFDFNAYFYLRRFKADDTTKFKVYSIRTNKCVSDELFNINNKMSKCIVVQKEDKQFYLVKEEQIQEINIQYLDDVKVISDEAENDYLLVYAFGTYSLYDTDLKELSADYKHIDSKVKNNLMVAERVDGTLTVLGTDGKEYIKSREYASSLCDLLIRDYDIKVETEDDEILISYDELGYGLNK